jgi:tetratricopeptide (TPR) repeat protein
VLALSATGRGLDAVPVAHEWREAAPENKKAYTDIMVALLAADPPRKLPADLLTQFVPFVNGEKSAEGAEALGWFAYNTGQVRTGGNWFKTSLDWKPSEAAAYGLALVRKRLGDRAGFDEIVRAWRSRSPRIARLAGARAAGPGAGLEVQRLVIRPTIHPLGPADAVQVAFAAVERPMTDLLDMVPLARDRSDQLAANDVYEVEADEDAEPALPSVQRTRVDPGRACALSRPRPEAMAGATALRFAWCLMELERPLEAIAYFDRAIAVGAAATRSEATYGKSLAYLRKGLTDEAAVAATEAPQTLRRSAELTTGILTQRALAFYKERRFTETLLTLDERAKFLPEQNDLMLMRGWSYFELGRFDEAEQVFRAVLKTGYSTEAARGLTAILERTKQVVSD